MRAERARELLLQADDAPPVGFELEPRTAPLAQRLPLGDLLCELLLETTDRLRGGRADRQALRVPAFAFPDDAATSLHQRELQFDLVKRTDRTQLLFPPP